MTRQIYLSNREAKSREYPSLQASTNYSGLGGAWGCHSTVKAGRPVRTVCANRSHSIKPDKKRLSFVGFRERFISADRAGFRLN